MIPGGPVISKLALPTLPPRQGELVSFARRAAFGAQGARIAAHLLPIAALILGSTCSAIKIIDRLASAGSRQSLPA